MNELLRAVALHGDTFGIGALLSVLLGILFRQLATGKLIFRKQLEEVRAACEAEITRTIVFYDKLIELKDQQVTSWETAYKNEAAASADQRRTSQEQLELARAADHMLRALPSSAPVVSKREGSE